MTPEPSPRWSGRGARWPRICGSWSPKNRRSSSGICWSVGIIAARFWTRSVTTAGMTRSTTGAYDVPTTAGGTVVATVATDAVGDAESMLLASGALHAAIVTTPAAIAATAAFLKYPLCMVGNHLYPLDGDQPCWPVAGSLHR